MAERESSALPASGLAVMIALLFGYVAVHEGTLERYRPAKGEKNSDQVIDQQDADARLWQDPFAAVQHHHDELQKSLDGNKPSEWIQRHLARHQFHTLRAEIDKALLQGPLTIVGVTVSSAPYAEDVERRQRVRYAALAGLNRSSFAPDNGDHIGYVVTRAGDPSEKCPRDIELLPDKIPYEWFSPTIERPPEAIEDRKLAQRRVLVLWLSESALAKQPVKSLIALTRCIGVSTDSPRLTMRMLGPSSSDTLRTLVKEQAGTSSSEQPKIEVYSPIATASNEALLAGLDKDVRIPVCTREGEAKSHRLCVVRTIVTDDKLAHSLVEELEKRGVSLRPGCGARSASNCARDRVALISEWDTFYGRSLPDAIGRVLCPDSPRQCDTVVRKSYLQGIDGTVPGDSGAQHTSGAQSKSEQKEVTRETARGERADGRHQFDYLRRLTDELKHHAADTEKGSIKAIGILGSDVYDKLLVLQALRGEFPQAQFFTTDVDARLLHPQEFKWARNIVVASGFGVQLRKELQGDIPPFRDTYQTSLFFSTLLALAPDSHAPDQALLDSKRLPPRIFETGRRHAYALDRDHAAGPCDRYRPLECTSIHPDSPPFVPDAVKSAWIYLPAVLLLAVIGLPLYSAYRRRSAPDLAGRLPASAADRELGIISRLPLDTVHALLAHRKARALKVFAITVLALIPILHLAAVLLLDQDFNHEPLAFYEGISVWPTEALRFFAGVLAIFLTYWAMLRMEANQVALTGWFILESRTRGMPEFDFNRRGVFAGIGANLRWTNLRRILSCDLLPVQTARLEAEQFWREYVFHSSLPASAIRTIIASTVFLLFSLSLLWLLGTPHTPYRGTFSMVVDRIAVLAWSTPLMLFLTFYVVDATLLCKRFVAALSTRHTAWPDDTRRHYGAMLAGAASSEDAGEAYDDWIDIRLIAERTAAVSSLVYYPLIVMIVLLFARSTLFDTWHWPVGLVAPVILSLMILFACHIALRRQAEAARSIALAKVARRLLVAKGQGVAGAALASQLELMLSNMEQIREGAFALFTQQPLIKALLIFFSASGLAMLEYFGIISF